MKRSWGTKDKASDDWRKISIKLVTERLQVLWPGYINYPFLTGYINYPFLNCVQRYANKETMPSPTTEIAVAGVQNSRILSGLLLSRLAAKNNTKNETARIQNNGEKKLSRKPPATAANPVALELLISRRATTSPGPSRATNTAAIALRTPRKVVTDSPPGISTLRILVRLNPSG